MKKEVKARWTATQIVDETVGHVEVDIAVTVHNLAELGFKYAVKHVGDKYASSLRIPIERYLAMSPEERRRECEKKVQAILKELAMIERGKRQLEEVKKTFSQEVVTGEMPVPVQKMKPLRIPDREEVQRIATEVRKMVYDSPQMQKILPLQKLVTIAENYGLDENWLSTAGYLLIEEIGLKQWLYQHKHSEQELRNKQYGQLLKMLENDFREMDKPISPRDISRFLGDRLFRNRVLHDGYKPTSEEAKDTRKMAIGLLEFLKRH